MFKQWMTGLLVLLGVAGMAATGVLLAHRSGSAPGPAWAIGLVLAALAYMIAYGLIQVQSR